MKIRLRHHDPATGTDKVWQVRDEGRDRIVIEYGKNGHSLRTTVVPREQFQHPDDSAVDEGTRRAQKKRAKGYVPEIWDTEPAGPAGDDKPETPSEFPVEFPVLYLKGEEEKDGDVIYAKERIVEHFGAVGLPFAAFQRETAIYPDRYDCPVAVFLFVLALARTGTAKVVDDDGNIVEPVGLLKRTGLLDRDRRVRDAAKALGLLPPLDLLDTDSAPAWFV